MSNPLSDTIDFYMRDYANRLARIADDVNALQQDFGLFRDESSSVIRDDRQLAMLRQMRRNLASDNLP